MNKLEKLKILVETIKDNNITAYEIGKSTKISVVTIQRIINGETKKPNDLTIDAIEDFLEKEITGTHLKNKKNDSTLNEPSTDYLRTTKPTTLVEELQGRIIVLSDELVKTLKENQDLKIKLEDCENLDK